MKNRKKLLAAMLALTMVASMAGCSGSENATSEPSTETKADVAETVGQKANDDMVITEVKEPNRTLEYQEDTDYGIEIYNENNLNIICMSLGLENSTNTCSLAIRVDESAQDQVLEWQDVRLWNESVPFYGENPNKSYLLKAGQFYLTDIDVDKDALNGKSISDCEDIVIQAKYGDTSIKMAIPVAEVNERRNPGHEKVKTFYIEEQEVYNDNNVIVTVPEQNFHWSRDTWDVDFTVELKDGTGLAIREVYVNDELIYTGELHPNANQVNLNTPYDMGIKIEKAELDILNNSTSEDNKISFNLIIADPIGNTIEEITATIPVTIKTDN